MNTTITKIPTWFWVISVILLLWNLMGVTSFVFHSIVMTGDALSELPKNEQALYLEYPMWTHIVFAVAVFSGLLGSILLLAKNKIAKPLFAICLVCVIIQMFHNLFLTTSIEVYGNEAYVMPVLVVLISVFSIWLADKAIKRNWIH